MTAKLPIIGEKSSCSTDSTSIVAAISSEVETSKYRGNAAIVTLGCAKNQVDSEVMLGVLSNSGFSITNNIEQADVVVVNTCGFLESAVRESIDSILDAASYKKSGRLRKLVVAGCMVERYKESLESQFPEVDAFITTQELLKVGEAAGGEFTSILSEAARPYFLYDEKSPRKLSTQQYTAYVKISEGCNRPCAFCVIPQIRGKMRSRSIPSILSEIEDLSSMGIRELNFVAQDLTNFGIDHKDGDLEALLHAVNDQALVDWVRLLYAYPIGVTEGFLKALEGLPRICSYLDMPLQHSSESVLKAMKRPLGKYSPRKVIDFIKSTVPSVVLRTTFIVGFPGETEADVDDLERFIREGHFMNVGIFTYSREEGTPSYDMENQIPEKEKEERRERLMLAQQETAEKILANYIGKEIDVLVEGAHEDTDLLLVGRSSFQAPEVDGTVLINDVEGSPPTVGDLGKVIVSEVLGYDLVGSWIGESS